MKMTSVSKDNSLRFLGSFAALVLVWAMLGGVSQGASNPGILLESPDEVVLSKDRVTLLDLFQRDGIPPALIEAMGSVDLGSTPAVGEHKVVKAGQLRDYLVRFVDDHGIDPDSVRVKLPETITVTRKTFVVPEEQLDKLFREHVTSNSPWDPQSLSIERIRYSGNPEIPFGDVSYEVTAMPRESYLGNVRLTVNCLVDGEMVRTLRVTGKVGSNQEVVVAKGTLRRDTVVRAGDVTLRKVDLAEMKGRFATRLEDVVGFRLTTGVRINDPISPDNLARPIVVRRGGLVTILYEMPGLKLTARGVVEGDASVGDTIEVTNVNSNKAIYCRVIDKESVRAIR